jgi:hypothetical protein
MRDQVVWEKGEITFDLDKGIMDIDTHVEEGGGEEG